MTYDKPCVTRHAKANACVHMHVNGKVYKSGGKSVCRGGEQQKGKEGKKIEKEKKKERRMERKRGGKGNRCFDGRNSSDQEVKSVYSIRATLQEVGILHTLV